MLGVVQTPVTVEDLERLPQIQNSSVKEHLDSFRCDVRYIRKNVLRIPQDSPTSDLLDGIGTASKCHIQGCSIKGDWLITKQAFGRFSYDCTFISNILRLVD